MLVFNKEEYDIKFFKKTNKLVFPAILILCVVAWICAYSYSGNFNSSENIESYHNGYEDTDYEDYEDTEYEDTDFTMSEPEEVTLYTGVHIGGADIVAGSYIASTTSDSGGNLFVYDDDHFLVYHEFYGSGASENKEGSPVYIDDGSEIKITGVSSITFTPVGN